MQARTLVAVLVLAVGVGVGVWSFWPHHDPERASRVQMCGSPSFQWMTRRVNLKAASRNPLLASLRRLSLW